MKKNILLVALASLSLIVPDSARGWGWKEHQLIASMAQSRLTPQAAEGMRQILGAETNVADLAVCPDPLAYGSSKCAGLEFGSYSASKPWHYINLPAGSNPKAADIDQYCKGGNCVSGRIRKELLTLNEPGASKHAKLLAIMFLLHFVADAHQPMHSVSHDDSGGNGKIVYYLGIKTNLHSLWDHTMYNFSPPHIETGEADGKPTLDDSMDMAAVAKELNKDLKNKDTSSWISGDLVADAVVESFRVAEDFAYPQYEKLHNNTLTPKDAAEMKPVFADRIERAVVRLAHLLNESFKAPPQPSRLKVPVVRGTSDEMFGSFGKALK